MSEKRKPRKNAAAAVFEQGRVKSVYVFDGLDPAWDPPDDIAFPEGPKRTEDGLVGVTDLAQYRYSAGRVPNNDDPRGRPEAGDPLPVPVSIDERRKRD